MPGPSLTGEGGRRENSEMQWERGALGQGACGISGSSPVSVLGISADAALYLASIHPVAELYFIFFNSFIEP